MKENIDNNHDNVSFKKMLSAVQVYKINNKKQRANRLRK